MTTVASENARTRVGLMQATLVDWQARAAHLRERIAELERREEEERREAIKRAPTQRPGGATTPAAQTRRKRRELVGELESLEIDIGVIEHEIVVQARAAVDEEVADQLAEAERFNRREQAIWREYGAAFEKLLHVWLRLVEHVERRDAHYARIETAEVRQQVREHFHPAQQPFPVDFGRAFQMALDATCDPGTNGYRSDPSAGSTRVKLGRLAEWLPDLRGVNRNAQLANGGAKTASSDRALQGFGAEPGGWPGTT